MHIPLCLLLFLLGGCATYAPHPVQSGRVGFLDRPENQPKNHPKSEIAQEHSPQSIGTKDSGHAARLANKSARGSVAGAKLPSPLWGAERMDARGGVAGAKLPSPHVRHSLRPGGFRWPLAQVSVTSKFGKRGARFHEGVDLKAEKGIPVYAARGGTVLYASEGISGYGLLVVVRHEGRISTLYAHNSKLLVHRGQTVQRGQLIAFTGDTGHVTGPHLHFEIRDGLEPLNPIAFFKHP